MSLRKPLTFNGGDVGTKNESVRIIKNVFVSIVLEDYVIKLTCLPRIIITLKLLAAVDWAQVT